MVELLHELSQLAPERCRWGTLRALDENGDPEFDMPQTCFLKIEQPEPGPVDGWVVGHGGHFQIDSNDPMIFWAVKEEILKRGWSYGLGHHGRNVYAKIEAEGFVIGSEEADASEAYVLLAALVEALTEKYSFIKA